jgi:hypothetical protein
MKVIAIDPGTTNLGWCYVVDDEVVTASVDKIWSQQTPVHMTLIPNTVNWYRPLRELFKEADLVLIELQYMSRGHYGLFHPMIVMETIIACCELDFPGKIKTIQSSAVKNHFQIRGTYEERKKEVVRKAGLNHLDGRVHDIADCLLMIDYEKAKQRKVEDAAQEAWERDKARKRIQFKIESRDRSPERYAGVRKCLTCSSIAHKTYVKRGKGFICGNCYGKEWRKEKKRLSNRL